MEKNLSILDMAQIGELGDTGHLKEKLNGSTANVALTLLLPRNLQTIRFILPELICIPEIMVLMVDSISFSLLSMTITYSP